MRICDKCKKPLRQDDFSSHFDLGYPFIYDLCHDCASSFLKHVNLFFRDDSFSESCTKPVTIVEERAFASGGFHVTPSECSL